MKAVAKKITAAALAAFMMMGLCPFAPAKAEDKPSELIVFAAASLTEPLEQVAELYKVSSPETDIILNFDSSGTLKTQIEEGAECDIFISASPKQMDELEEEGYLKKESRVALLENQIVLAGTKGKEKTIGSFEELKDILVQNPDILLAIGNSDVPAGQYALSIFKYLELEESDLAAAGVLTYASNVKEIATQVSEETVDLGILYATDAVSAELEVFAVADEEMCGQVLYPAAILKDAENAEAAAEFMGFLQGEEAMKIFESIGFTPVVKEESN